MMRSLTHGWIAVACLAGCSDFSQHRIGGVRNLDSVAELPKSTSPLQISNPPAAAAPKVDKNVQQATLAPAPVDPNNALKELHQRAKKSIVAMDSYIFRLRRREAVDGK